MTAPAPTNTYRVQLTPQFGFDDAAAILPYLAELGVTHLYCSPWLQAAPGSQHGYDVVDHSRVNRELGGPDAHARLIEAAAANDVGIILDIVPNHMAVSEPESQNAQWWSLLRDGRDGPHGHWFDVDWDACDGRVLVPILGAPLAEAQSELKTDSDVIRYYDHEVPAEPAHYRLADWHMASENLNYRRFFDVTTLAGIRVEDNDVFDTSHALIVQQVSSGAVQGLRIDHPDGLADPEGYLARLADQTGNAWTVVEKILEPGEELPTTWKCAGTTGYDALNVVLETFVDSAAEATLTDLYVELTGETADYDVVVESCKRQIVTSVLSAEVNRLTTAIEAVIPEAQDITTRGIREALIELLVAFDVYRAYVTPGTAPDETAAARLDTAAAKARSAAPHRFREIALVSELIRSGPADIVTRFQQTCGPVMAKGVEDTAFYRYHRLNALNEVGGDPGHFGSDVEEFHAWCERMQHRWPTTMTALSTHDTKRSEDVRARLITLSLDPEGWTATARTAMARLAELGPRVDANARYLLLQTLVGVWPAATDRITAYLEKATREAKRETNWTAPDEDYDEAVATLVAAAVADDTVASAVEDWLSEHADLAARTSRAMKLAQLTMPGVADCYQGTETEDLSLVDPDNRRPVDYPRLLETLRDGSDPKQRVVAAALRLRKERPEWFGAEATYQALGAGEGALAFMRSNEAITVVPVRNGVGTSTVTLPPGRWRDLLSDRWHEGTSTVAGILGAELGVALLVRE